MVGAPPKPAELSDGKPPALPPRDYSSPTALAQQVSPSFITEKDKALLPGIFFRTYEKGKPSPSPLRGSEQQGRAALSQGQAERSPLLSQPQRQKQPSPDSGHEILEELQSYKKSGFNQTAEGSAVVVNYEQSFELRGEPEQHAYDFLQNSQQANEEFDEDHYENQFLRGLSQQAPGRSPHGENTYVSRRDASPGERKLENDIEALEMSLQKIDLDLTKQRQQKSAQPQQQL